MDPEGNYESRLSYTTKSSRDTCIDIKADDDDDDPLNEAPEDRADVANSKRFGDDRLGAWEDDCEEKKRTYDYLGASAPPLPGVSVPAEDSSPSSSPLAAEEDAGKPSPVANNQTKGLSPPDEPALNSVVVPIGPGAVDSLPVALPIVTNAVGGGLNATLPLPEVPDTAQPRLPQDSPAEEKSLVSRRKACSTKKILLVCLIVILLGGLAATLTILLWPDEIQVHDPKEPPISDDDEPDDPKISDDGEGREEPKINDGDNKPEEPKTGDGGNVPTDPKIGDGTNPYPNCHVAHFEYITDGVCDGGLYNTAECGWDGEDCLDFNKRYPNCHVELPFDIGDDECDGFDYNTAECGWDGGDCLTFNRKYPNCDVEYPTWIGDGECDGGEYNVASCEWDGGDCIINQETEEPTPTEEPTEENVLYQRYPNCQVSNPSKVGDGNCDTGVFNTQACGWDDGDCSVRGYPDCHVDDPDKVGDGKCDGGRYNSVACGWDDGDCSSVEENGGDPEDWPKLNNRACTFHFGPNGVEGVDFKRWEDVDLKWCTNKCRKTRVPGTCRAFDFDKDKDRCRVFYTYPRTDKAKDNVMCWKNPDDS